MSLRIPRILTEPARRGKDSEYDNRPEKTGKNVKFSFLGSIIHVIVVADV